MLHTPQSLGLENVTHFEILTNMSIYVQFQEILKPNYNSVDLAEVELVAGNEYINEPRANDSELLEVSFQLSKPYLHTLILYMYTYN